MNCNSWTPLSAHRAFKTAIATAALLSVAAVPSMAVADTSIGATQNSSNAGVYVTILSPNPGTSFAGVKEVEVSAYYESSYGVSSIELYIDGKRMATQKLNSPENRGEISFDIEAAALRGGQHSIVVRATATDEEVASARTSLNLPPAPVQESTDQSRSTAGQADEGPASDVAGAPALAVVDPISNGSVQGIVRIKVNAEDPSGKSPYVSLFIDHAFKTLRNFPPYVFDWDTTRLANGYHTIEVWGYNDSQLVGHASPVRVLVNNPGGRTFERHDLSDFTATAQPKHTNAPVAAKPQATIAAKPAAVVRPLSLGEPMIAHAAKQNVFTSVANDTRLASINLGSVSNEPASVNETLIAPVVSETPISATERALASLPAPQPKTAKNFGEPLLSKVDLKTSSLATDGSKLEQIASIGSGDLESGEVSTAITQPSIPSAVVLPQQSVAQRAFVPVAGSPVLVMTPLATAAIKTPTKLEQIASASVDDSDIYVGADQITAPAIAKIQAEAAQEMPALIQHTVSISDLTSHDRNRLNGAYQVVFDDRRVALDRPLQSRGSILFAPFRQIFESEGGQLEWDNAKQSVHAVSADRDISVTIGSKKASVNNQVIPLSAAPYLFLNRTMLPLDFFPLAMNVRISYDALTGHLIIVSR